MVIDGSVVSERNIDSMISWDVNNGIARRSWARNTGAPFTITKAMEKDPKLDVTLPKLVDSNILDDLFEKTR